MYIYIILRDICIFAVLKICITNTLHCIYIVITNDIQIKWKIQYHYIIITTSLHCIYNVNTNSLQHYYYQLYLYNLHKKSSKNCVTIQIQKSLVCLQFVNKSETKSLQNCPQKILKKHKKYALTYCIYYGRISNCVVISRCAAPPPRTPKKPGKQG